METKISRSKWEIGLPSLYWRRSTHRQVEEVQGLEDTVRGSDGFGSTGVNEKNDTKEKKEPNGKNERTEKKEEEIKMRL